MAQIQCPGCSAPYDLAQAAKLGRFKCGRCSQVIVVQVEEPEPETEPELRAVPAKRSPRAAASSSSGRPRRRKAEPKSEPKRPARSSRSERSDRGADDEDSGPNKVLIGAIGGGAIVVIAVVAMVLGGGDDDATATPVGDGTAVVPGAAGGGPEELAQKDPEAWKLLPREARERLATAKVAAVDLTSEPSVRTAVAFFRARGEDARVKHLAIEYLKRNPSAIWAQDLAGFADLRPRIEKCLRKAEFAYEYDLPEYKELKDLLDSKAPGGRVFRGDAETVAQVDALIKTITDFDERLASPYHEGIERWVRYQRTIPVMRDLPAVSGHVGPYVIFAQLDVDVDAEDGKKITLENAPKEAREKAEKVLAHNMKLFSALYEGWMKHIGSRLDLERYGPDNADFDTLMKANIFPSHEAYAKYNLKIGSGGALNARAYYSLQEPRFICTYVAGEDEEVGYTNQVQCHEGTHQLVHFYTWNQTRKKLGRALEWLSCRPRRLWSVEGFAEFFSSHTEKNGEFTWMVPLDERLWQIEVFEEIIRRKGWKNWTLDEILKPKHGGDLSNLTGLRATDPKDAGYATMLFSNLFYGKAWSLNYFLWFAEENGKPKYRDQFAKYQKAEFIVRVNDGGHPINLTSRDLKNAMGLTTPERLAAFEAEWQAYEKKVIDENRKPKWAEERKEMLERFKLDPTKRE